jgi:hypothetical protein
MVKMKTTYTQENFMTDFSLSEPKDFKIVWGCLVHRLMSYSRFLPPQLLKEITICKKQSQATVLLFLSHLRLNYNRLHFSKWIIRITFRTYSLLTATWISFMFFSFPTFWDNLTNHVYLHFGFFDHFGFVSCKTYVCFNQYSLLNHTQSDYK